MSLRIQEVKKIVCFGNGIAESEAYGVEGSE